MNDEESRELKNSIFAAQLASQGAQGGLPTVQGMPVQTAAQAAKQAIGFDLPVASVPLPSGGKIYPDGPLHLAEYIDLKAMTAREEDILMNRNLVRKGTVITELIKSCIIDKNIDVNSLISGDRNALMVAVRITGYSADYSPKVTCPACDTQQDFSVNLENLPVKELDLTKVKQVGFAQNAFEFTLPMSKKTVVYKFLTGKEEERILQDLEAKRKKGIVQENLVTTKLMNSIIAIEGNTERGFINQFCQYMPARDSLALRTILEETEPGIDMSSEFVCNGCGHQEVLTVPLGPTFFWPNAR
jgi:hypothetical protein